MNTLNEVMVFKVKFPSIDSLMTALAAVTILAKTGRLGDGVNGSLIVEDERAVVFFFGPKAHSEGKALYGTFELYDEAGVEAVRIVDVQKDDLELVDQALMATKLQIEQQKTADPALN